MRIGPLEIIITIIVVIAALLLTRMARFKPGNAREAAAGREQRPRNLQGYAKRLGLALLIAGILFALAGISMFRWALQGYSWALILLAVGLVILLVSKRK